jgi:hypothetical protein
LETGGVITNTAGISGLASTAATSGEISEVVRSDRSGDEAPRIKMHGL